MAVTIVHSANLPEGLLDEIADQLNLSEGEPRNDLIQKLQRMADIFVMGREVEEWWGTPGPQRAALGALARQLDRTIVAMNRIKVDYAQALNRFARKPTGYKGPSDVSRRARDAITDLGSAIRQFDSQYKPLTGPAPDLTLEHVVRGLMTAIQAATGSMPQPQMNKHVGERPALKSPGAKAIGMLLEQIDPALNQTTIANMMVKVREQERPSESHLHALFGIDPNAERRPSRQPAPLVPSIDSSPWTTADYCAYFGIDPEPEAEK